MGFWGFENDTLDVILDHLGDKVPTSIAQEAKQELRRRGWNEEQIRTAEWERMD